MPERLTESLIRRGVLNDVQANEAMERQVLQGGALDTSLLELELVDEIEVVEALSAAYGLTTASPEEALVKEDRRAVRAFPEQWARKHMIAPLGFDRRRNLLSVLTPAPADLNLIARLGELLEITIEPVLAPEFRVWQRIALLYESEPPDRLSTLIDRFGHATPVEVPEAEPESEPEPRRELTPLAFGEAVNALRDARHRDGIAETTLRYAVKDLELAALFIVHADHVEGWMGAGPSSEKVPKLQIPLKSDSAFRVVLDTQAHYLGPLPSDSLHEEFLEGLGRPEPRAVLIVPLRIRSRTVALLYAENRTDTIAPRLAADLMLFTTHVQGALESLLIRKKAESITDLSSRPMPPAELPRPIQLGKKEVDDGEAPDQPMEPLRPPTTEYAYVRSKQNGEMDESPEAVVDETEPVPVLDPTVRARVPLARIAPTPEPVEEEEEDGWDSVDIKPSNELMTTAGMPEVSDDEPPEDPTTRHEMSVVSIPGDDTDSSDSVDLEEDTASPQEGNGRSEVFMSAVLAESTDGGALLDELEAMDSAAEATTGDLEDGWDDVQVETWDEFGQRTLADESGEDSLFEHTAPPSEEAEQWIEKGYQELKAMRESLGEDATVPDLSAEAWIRASSDVTKPRPLPPEVMERAAMPADEGISAAHYRGIVHADPLDPGESEVVLGAMLEPVPLTQRTTGSYEAESIDATQPMPAMRFAEDEPLDDNDVRHHHEHLVNGHGNVVSAREEIPLDVDEPSELDILLSQVMSANREERTASVDRLRAFGPEVLPALAEIFPGITDVDPFTNSSGLPSFGECGVLCGLMAHYGADAHPYVASSLEAPESLKRFFAVYYYSAVFIPEIIPRLIQRLHDEESKICMLSARTLFMYREHPDFERVLDHLHGRLDATSVTARRHAAYLIGLFRDVTAIPKLIDVFDRREKALFEVTEDALAEITKQRFGGSGKKWRTWWSKNQDKSRIEWLIDGLTAKDSSLRRSAADELRAVTGLDMGYDEDAPKRQREDARKRWVEWWSEQG